MDQARLHPIDFNLRLALRDFPDVAAGNRLGGYFVLELGYLTASGDGSEARGGLIAFTLGGKYQLAAAFALTADVGISYSTPPYSIFHVPLRLGLAVEL